MKDPPGTQRNEDGRAEHQCSCNGRFIDRHGGIESQVEQADAYHPVDDIVANLTSLQLEDTWSTHQQVKRQEQCHQKCAPGAYLEGRESIDRLEMIDKDWR